LGTTKALLPFAFFAPAGLLWARTTVLSSINHSTSPSADSRSISICQTPFSCPSSAERAAKRL